MTDEREEFEAWWATLHDAVWAAVEDGHAEGARTMMMMLTRRDTEGPQPHMFVGKNFDDVGIELTMLEDSTKRVGLRAFDSTVQRRIVDVQNQSRQARRRTMREVR